MEEISLDWLKQGRLPGRGSTLEASRRMDRGKGRDHYANVSTQQGIDMAVEAMAIPSKDKNHPGSHLLRKP